jgi:hypothetical protein
MIFKLTYLNKDTAIADLLAKGVYINTDEGLAYGEGVAAIVEIGLIVLDIVATMNLFTLRATTTTL